MIGIVNDTLPAGYHVEVSDEGSPIKSATSAAGASLSQLNSPTLTGWGRGGTDVASPDHWEVYATVITNAHLQLCKRTRIVKVHLGFSKVFGITLNNHIHWHLNGSSKVQILSDQMWNCWKSDQMLAGKWQTFTPTHEPGHIFKIGNIPLSRLVFRNWCLATTLGITFWVWCDLWRLQYGNSFIILQFIESDIYGSQ